MDTPRDRSTVFQVITWILFITAGVSVCGGVGTKYVLSRRLRWDDGFILLGLLSFLIECICISLGASNGLGKDDAGLSRTSLQGLLKGEYASIPFLMLSFALVKWSISIFIKYLSPSTAVHRSIVGLRAAILVWLVTGIVPSLFACAMPTPWDYVTGEKCMDRRAWWAYVAVVNVMTEIVIIGLYLLILGGLHTSRAKRFVILSLFCSRVLVVGTIVAQLALFRAAYPGPNVTGALWLPQLFNQVAACVSAVTACLPYLKPLMESLETGLVRTTVAGSEAECNSQHASSYPRTIGSGTRASDQAEGEWCRLQLRVDRQFSVTSMRL